MRVDAEILIPNDVFNEAYLPYLESQSRTQIFYGGAGSGKSVFLAQRCIFDLLRGDRNYLICREFGVTLRKSVFTEIERVIELWDLEALFSVNRSDFVVTCENGYQAYFVGLDDPQKLKSIVPRLGVITDIWVEEATETSWKKVKELYKRQRGGDSSVRKRLMLSFNPILIHHWIYKSFFKPINWSMDQTEYADDRLSIFRTWYIHNRFLTSEDISDLQGEQDVYYHSVYTEGQWGILGDVIFKNWRVEDLSQHKEFDRIKNGLDFGFADDPAAGIRLHYDSKHKKLYVLKEFYETGLTNDILDQRLQSIIPRKDLIVADSAEPKSIAELQSYGRRAIGAKKGPDSVLHGIQWLQQQEIIVDSSCVNLQNELLLFHWKEDKAGNRLPVTVGADHLIDAMRYATEDEMIRARRLNKNQPVQISKWKSASPETPDWRKY